MARDILIQTLNFVVILNILFSLCMFERNGRRTAMVCRKIVHSTTSYAVTLMPALILVYLLYATTYRF